MTTPAPGFPPTVARLTNASLAGGERVDVTIADGTIASVDPAGATSTTPGTIVDLEGYLLLPAPVEPHAHLDKAFLAERIPNPTGDLLGAIEAMNAHRHLLGVDETIERAERAARMMAANGVVAIRTHVDVTPQNGLVSLDAVAEVRRRLAGLVDIEIVALCGFPTLLPDQLALLRDALAAGADLVGGCPYLDDDLEDTTATLLAIADEYGVGIDLHTDETLDPAADALDVLARHVSRGFTHGATASHCVSLGQQPPDAQRATAERVAAAQIVVVTLPHTNLYLQGRGRAPMPRGLTALEALRDAGVTVAAGADNLQDPFNPVGRGDPFDTANLLVIAGHYRLDEAWHAVSHGAAAALRRPCGIVAGGPADLLAVRTPGLRTAVAFAPSDRLSWRAGVLREHGRDVVAVAVA